MPASRKLFERLLRKGKKQSSESASLTSNSSSSVVSKDEDESVSDDVRERLGLFEFPPVRGVQLPTLGSDVRQVDIIAVHGLSGSWKGTWTVRDGDKSYTWLRDRLPSLLAPINVRPRIRSFGYDAAYAFTKASSTLETSAMDLLTRVRSLRLNDANKDIPIIFVAHSMGGLVVKLAINMAHTDHEYHADVLTNTRGCVFLAVPFHGADLARWAKIGSQIINISSLGTRGNPNIPMALTRNSKQWQTISRDFVQRGKDMTFRSAYETERLGLDLIVDESSVRNNVPNERVFPVPGSNHRNICKFGEKELERFAPVGLAVFEVVKEAIAIVPPTIEPTDTPSGPVLSDLPVATPAFFGRGAQIEELKHLLDPSTQGRKGVLLYGIGGSGKTQLALRFIQETQNLYQAVIWLNVFTNEHLSQSLEEVSQMIKHSWLTPDTPNIYNGNDKARLLKSRLTSTTHRQWLLVLDSADNLDQVNLLQLIPDCRHGSILVTSTRKEISDTMTPHGFKGIEIDNLDDESSGKLLLYKAGVSLSSPATNNTNPDPAKISQIVKVLNGIPIAIEQAGIILRKRVLTFDNFVTEYRKHYDEIMGRPAQAMEVLHEKGRSISIILDMLYSYIERQSQGAAVLLRILAILGPSRIPIPILLEVAQFKPQMPDISLDTALLEDTTALDETLLHLYLSLLDDITLIKIKPATAAASESVFLHGSVCQWLLSVGPSSMQTQIVSTALAVCHTLCCVRDTVDWPMRSQGLESSISRISLPWMKRIETQLAQISRPFLPQERYPVSYPFICRDIGFVYFCNSQFNDAKRLLMNFLDYLDHEAHSSTAMDKEKAITLYCTGISIYKSGEYEKAQPLLQAALDLATSLQDDNLCFRATSHLSTLSRRIEINSQQHETAVAASRGTKMVPSDQMRHAEDVGSFRSRPPSMPGFHSNTNARAGTAIPTYEEHANTGVSVDPDIIEKMGNFTGGIKIGSHKEASPLIRSLRDGDRELAQQLLEAGLFLDIADGDGMRPLHWASAKGYVPEATMMLQNSCDPNCYDNFGVSPIYLASEEGHIELVRLLIENGANPSWEDDLGRTPLQVSFTNGHFELFQILVENGADLDFSDHRDLKPIDWVGETDRADLIHLLLDKGASINGAKTGGSVPLILAIESKKLKMVETLLLSGANAQQSIHMSHNSPLHLAVEYEQLEIVQLLLKFGAEPNVMNNRGKTPLQFARERENPFLVGALTLGGASMGGRIFDPSRLDDEPTDKATSRVKEKLSVTQNPLSVAMEQNDENEVSRLISEGADLGSEEPHGRTLLHKAATSSMTKLLLEAGADPNKSNSLKQTPLHFAVCRADLEASMALIRAGADVNACTVHDVTPLSLALSMHHLEMTIKLLQMGADGHMPAEDLWILIFTAVSRGNNEAVTELLKICIPNDTFSGFEKDKLFWFIVRAKVSIDLKVESGDSLLEYYVKRAVDESEMAFDVKSWPSGRQTLTTYTPLTCAFLGANMDAMTMLLENGYTESNTVFMTNLERNAEISRLMLDSKEVVDIKERYLGRALYYAVRDQDYLLTSELISRGADANYANYSIKPNCALLEITVKHQNARMVKLLLDGGADVNQQDLDGYTALHTIAELGNLEISRILISHGANVNCKSMRGDLPIHFAAKHSHPLVLDALIDAGADVSTPDYKGRTPLHFAAMFGLESSVYGLLKHGADVFARDHKYQTCLHLAADQNNVSIIRALLSSGAARDAADKNGRTAFDRALETGFTDAADELKGSGRRK